MKWIFDHGLDAMLLEHDDPQDLTMWCSDCVYHILLREKRQHIKNLIKIEKSSCMMCTKVVSSSLMSLPKDARMY